MSLDIEGVLSAHRFDFGAVLVDRDDDGRARGYSLGCSCGDFRYSPGPDAQVVMQAHVAAVLREQIDGALAEAWEQAHAVFCTRGGGGMGHDVCSTHLRPGDRHLLAAHLSDTERAGDAEGVASGT